MRKGIATAAALLLAFNASAQVVYKCVGPDGTVVYQSNHCDSGQQATDAWSAQPTSPHRAAEIERRRQQRQQGAQHLQRIADRYRNPAAANIPVKPRPQLDACGRARRQREQYRETNHGNYAVRDALDDAVMEACY